MTHGLSRRGLLLAAGSAMTALAGCGGGERATPTQPRERTPTASDDDASQGQALDLREANVVGVQTERQNGTVRFDVTLHHDDDGEDGYANWWQVESLDGTRVGRRVLTHPHSRQPFTRSDTVELPATTTCVAVRGHDQTHGYGGQAMLVDLDSGATRAVRQGRDRRSFSASECP